MTGLSDAFALFGLERRFSVDRPAVQTQYYALSRECHPDRVTGQSPAAQLESARRMSELNDAYRTLMDPHRTREHLIALVVGPLANSETGKKTGTALPLELAEAWFDLQEKVLEDAATASGRIAAFEADLRAWASRLEETALAAEQVYDRSGDRDQLTVLQGILQQQSYLTSLTRDVAQLSARLRIKREGA